MASGFTLEEAGKAYETFKEASLNKALKVVIMFSEE